MGMVETVDDVLSQMRDFCSGMTQDAAKLEDVFNGYMKNSPEYRTQQAEYLKIRALNIIHFNRQRLWYYYLMTFLVCATEDRGVYRELLQYCIKDQSITKETKFFLYYQFLSYSFTKPDILNEEIGDFYDDLYNHIYYEYKRELGIYDFIQKEERNQDFVMVFTSQVLEMGHAPTKTLLDRCYMLEKFLEKKVLIVNTAEFMSFYRPIYFYNYKVGSYIEEYSNKTSVLYKDKEFSFFQCPKEMPDVSVIKEIMDVVKSEKPYFILTIGGNSIVSDLCSEIVPTIAIATVYSDRTMTYGQFQAIGRKISDSDRRWMRKHSLPEDHIIESLFSFEFKEQTHQYSRKELGLPEDKFIVILVGGRLDDEIDPDCMHMLQRLTDIGICVAFIGRFHRYQTYAEQNEIFKRNSIDLGFQEDVLAIDECCDLYINPRRVGGGTSAAEALYKGLPVVTFDFGDVGVCAGADFQVSSYDAMYDQIVRYDKDKEFYTKMSIKAKERAAQLMDSRSEFMKIIQKAESSERF